MAGRISIHRADVMAEHGLYEDGKKGMLRLSDPQRRLQDQDTDGVQAAVISADIRAVA
ncbi:MAG: hypothetical protein O7G88_22390 [bacterium]|nr:hypothetical protein [bacterium]